MVVEAKVGVVLALVLVVALVAAVVVEVVAVMLVVVVVMVETDVADIGVDVSVDVNANMLTRVMAARFVMPELLEVYRCCCAAFACRPMAALNRGRVLQAWRPAYHVRPNLALAALPQCPNQEPLRPQQLIFPDFTMVPHFGHTKPIALVVTRYMGTLVKTQREKREHTVCMLRMSIYIYIYIYNDVSLGLTFACLDALRPLVISVSVANTSTIFIPSTARSATADSAGFLERVALWAHCHLIGRCDSYCGHADLCGSWRADYFQVSSRK